MSVKQVIRLFGWLLFGLPLWGALAFANAEPLPMQSMAGVIYPIAERELSFSTSGLIARALVREGDLVNQGDLLIALEADLSLLEVERRRMLLEDQTAIEVLQERLSILQEQYASLRSLFEQSSVVSLDELRAFELEMLETNGQLSNAQFRKRIEETELAMELAMLEQTQMLSPIDGVVTDVIRQPGEWAQGGEPIVRIVDMRQVELRATLPDQLVRSLQVGQQVMVSIEHVGTREGRVAYIAPVADPASSRVWVHVVVDNEDASVIAGMRASMLF